MKEKEQRKNPLYLFVSKEQEPGRASWVRVVDIFDNNTANLCFYRDDPCCSDGYSEKMASELEKRGWESGEMRKTFKKNISLEELLSSIAYTLGYEKVFKSKAKSLYAINPFTVTEFLGLVDSQAERELARIKTTQKQELNTKRINKELMDTIIKEGKLEKSLL